MSLDHLLMIFKLSGLAQSSHTEVTMGKGQSQYKIFFKKLLASFEPRLRKVKEMNYLASKREQSNSTKGHEWSWETRATRFSGYAGLQL